MDEWRCFGCKCTFESGCELEREMAAMPPRRRYIPLPPLPIPKKGTLTLTREQQNANAKKNYRKRIERNGGTVRTRK